MQYHYTAPAPGLRLASTCPRRAAIPVRSHTPTASHPENEPDLAIPLHRLPQLAPQLPRCERVLHNPSNERRILAGPSSLRPVREAAGVLGITVPAAKECWAFARAWLYHEIQTQHRE